MTHFKQEREECLNKPAGEPQLYCCVNEDANVDEFQGHEGRQCCHFHKQVGPVLQHPDSCDAGQDGQEVSQDDDSVGQAVGGSGLQVTLSRGQLKVSQGSLAR